jgi:ATP-dependent Lon protease
VCAGVRIVNRPTPAPLRESVQVAEQILIAQARNLVGDRSSREHEFNVQARALDASKSGGSLGLPVLLALCSSRLQRSIKGGLMAIGNLTLGGGLETLNNAAELAEIAMEK